MPIQRCQNRAAWTAIFLLMFCLACEREPGILVNIEAWPEGVERILTRTTLADTTGTDFVVDRDQSRFAVRVPVGSQGTVQIVAVGLDAMGCKLAEGSLTEPVPDNLSRFAERTMVLSTLPFHICPFGDVMRFSLNSPLYALAAGDFNDDTKSDLAVVKSNDNKISVLLSSESTLFSVPLDISVGSIPSSVAVADFNGDGKADLAVTNSKSDKHSVLLGSGMGGFGPARDVTVGMNFNSIAVGDFNEDKRPDLAVANMNGDTVSVLLGDGTGGFGAPKPIVMLPGSKPISIAVGDFNGDGKTDLAVANFGGATVGVMLGDGMGNFGVAQSFGAGNLPASVAVGDFNNDMKLDLVVTSVGNSPVDAAVTVLLGNGAGGFGSSSIKIDNPPRSVTVGDFNGDGKLDLALACAGSTVDRNEVRVLQGDGMGGFSLSTISAVGKNPSSIVVGDFNGDRQPDLAVTAYTDREVDVLLNRFDKIFAR